MLRNTSESPLRIARTLPDLCATAIRFPDHCAPTGIGLRNGDFNHTFPLVIWKIIDFKHQQ
jgi:hypothetical protein